jgi:hypothetical protein
VLVPPGIGRWHGNSGRCRDHRDLREEMAGILSDSSDRLLDLARTGKAMIMVDVDRDCTKPRAHERLAFEVSVDILSEHNFYGGLSLNVSEGGIFATHVHHPVGTRLEIRLLLQGDAEPTTLLTEVRWVREHIEASDFSAGSACSGWTCHWR